MFKKTKELAKRNIANIITGSIFALGAVTVVGTQLQINEFNNEAKNAKVITRNMPGYSCGAHYLLFDYNNDGIYDKIKVAQKIVAGRGAGLHIYDLYPSDRDFKDMLSRVINYDSYWSKHKGE